MTIVSLFCKEHYAARAASIVLLTEQDAVWGEKHPSNQPHQRPVWVSEVLEY